jgi:hypothetical protein
MTGVCLSGPDPVKSLITAMLLQGYPAGKNKSCASGGQASHQNYGPPETKDPTDMAGWRIPQKCNSSGSSKSQAWRPTVRRTHMRGTHAH